MDETIEVRDKRNGNWYWIQRDIFENYTERIGVIGLAIYNAYSSYARDTGNAWPSQQTISKKLGISVPTLIKFNGILEKEKLIKVASGKKKGVSNKVFLLKVRGIKQVKTPSKRGLDLGINVVKTNEKHLEREEENDIAASAAKEEYRFDSYLTKVRTDSQSSIRIIGDYWFIKGFRFETLEQSQKEIKRSLRVANELKAYSEDRVNDVMDWLQSNAEFKWTLETVLKYINEDLSRIKVIKKQKVHV